MVERERNAVRVGLVALVTALIFGFGHARADIPDELYESLGLSRTASPEQLFNALEKRYHDPEQGAGKGAFAEHWEPIPMSKYLNPHTFYTPPDTVDVVASRGECVECHEAVTPGWVHAWRKSVHADINEIRSLPKTDSRYYKREIIAEVEGNLRSLGKLPRDQQLAQVSCIDCHVGIGAEQGDHAKDLRLPDAAVCGTCHLRQWAERESERDTLNWPQDQWPKGRPSHALDYRANVETAIWAAMEQREVAEGCTFCHNNQTKCDTCHTRHEFSVVEARKPEACATCHNGVDHNEFEMYMLSKHGTVYQTRGDTWDWQVPLEDAVEKGGMNAPTCAYCHMEYEGEFGHNLVRKVRWAFNPTPAIADNLDHEWFTDRQEAWVETCGNCHSQRFARAYLEFIDKGTIDGLAVEQAAKEIVTGLYDDGLLRGQQDNRPAPPVPEKDAPGAFFGLFWAKGNNPSAVEYEYAEMWEHHLIKHYKGLAHVSPGGYTYSEGWSQLIKSYARIQDANTQIREMASLKARVAELSGGGGREMAGLIGLAMIVGGFVLVMYWRRRTA